ncbi:MAG: hypothetical protein WA324_29320 [Bryobacteraceae bacterium]
MAAVAPPSDSDLVSAIVKVYFQEQIQYSPVCAEQALRLWVIFLLDRGEPSYDANAKVTFAPPKTLLITTRPPKG